MSTSRAFSSWKRWARTSSSIPKTEGSPTASMTDSPKPRRRRTNMPKAEFPIASLPAPGRMHVDWEERVDFRRLHEYRLGRTRDAIAKAGLGALLVFDMNNIHVEDQQLSLIHISEPT